MKKNLKYTVRLIFYPIYNIRIKSEKILSSFRPNQIHVFQKKKKKKKYIYIYIIIRLSIVLTRLVLMFRVSKICLK